MAWYNYIGRALQWLAVGTNFLGKIKAWSDEATSADSDGGEEITLGEWTKLGGMFAQAILEELNKKVKVTIEPE